MRVTLVAMGCENISLQALSAVLKEHGHEVNLAFDQALFDDKNYLTIPFLARVFDHRKKVVNRIMEQQPDVVGFSVFASNYLWALDIARRVKQQLDVPIIFGGIHPTTCPERVLSEDCVDIICLGEGEYPLLELVESLERGQIDYSIRNLWFKRDGKIIKNPLRPLVDIEKLPLPDKSLFENDVPIKYYYLAITSRGCPYACNYCSLSYLKEFERGLGKHFRERSVDSAIHELKVMKERYNYDWVDMKNNILSPNKAWTLEFLRRYKEEIGRPLRVFAHPYVMDRDVARALKEAGCWRVQIGIQSMNPQVRRNILNRRESNEVILNAFKAMDEVGLSYSIDHIFGLPGETEEDLIYAVRIYSQCKSLARVTPFWLGYLPKTRMIDIGLREGLITCEDVERIESGGDQHYIATGSITDKKKIRKYKSYHLFLRMMPITPKRLIRFILDHKLQRYFRFLPQSLLIHIVDFIATFKVRDQTSEVYIKSYFWEFSRRFRRGPKPKTGKKATVLLPWQISS